MSKASTFFLAAALALPASALADPAKLAGIGDSISQGFAANNFPGDHADMAFGQGSDREVNSLYLRYKARFPAFAKEFVSVSGAEMVGGSNNAAAQASRICRQTRKPDRVVIELGGNDVCNRSKGSASDAASNLYSVTTYRNALKAALDTLGGCLPTGAQVLVLSMPRVDFLYKPATPGARFRATPCGAWPASAASSPAREMPAAAARSALASTSTTTACDRKCRRRRATTAARSVRHRLAGTAGQQPQNSVGAYAFGKDDIDSLDCFHPLSHDGTEAPGLRRLGSQ